MRRLLFISHRVPYPPDKGERVRAFHEITALAEHFRVTLAALAHSDGDVAAAMEMGRWCEKVLTGRAGGRLGFVRGALSAVTGRSVTEGFFRNRRLMDTLREEASKDPFDIVFGYSSSTLPYVLAVPTKARVMDLVDVDSAKWEAYAQTARGPKRWLYAREARGVRALERMAVERCDAIFLVSEAETQTLEIRNEKVAAVGNGVDTEFFKPMDRPAGPPALVFTGTMDYHPNIEGVCWFAREVWPGLRRQVPELTFTVVGRDPTPEVRHLADLPGIRVTGTVADVRPFLSSAAVAIVPLRTARGIQNKILEAMAMGRAVVASPPAIEGLDVAVGKEILRADSPDEWHATILGLLSDPGRRESIGRAARERAVTSYSWASHTAPLVSVATRLAMTGTPSPVVGSLCSAGRMGTP
jgi:polysaccharide biosynthesis protein PslH